LEAGINANANFAGEIRKITGQGMPIPRMSDHGDLFIHFEVVFPQRLGSGTPENPLAMLDKEIQALESVLPARQPQSVPPSDVMTEDFTLEKSDGKSTSSRSANAHDEDDDEDVHGGPQGVQCQSQ